MSKAVQTRFEETKDALGGRNSEKTRPWKLKTRILGRTFAKFCETWQIEQESSFGELSAWE